MFTETVFTMSRISFKTIQHMKREKQNKTKKMWPNSDKKTINKSQTLDNTCIGNIKPELYRNY